jgi:cysteine desulfurase/selenocysteine lyase
MMLYLDHAATGLPRCEAALEALVAATHLANPGRGLSRCAREAAAEVERSREAVGALVGGGTVCFSASATAALNQAIAGQAGPIRCIALGPMAHNAARRAALAVGCPVWVLPAGPDGRIDLDRTRARWRSDVDLVVVSHASNVTGRRQPVVALAEIAHDRGAAIVVDAAQTIGLVDATELALADFVAISGHKGLRAVPGVGALVVRGTPALRPLVVGGTGHDARDEDMPAELPARLEAGSLNVPGIAAFGAAARTCSPDEARASAMANALRDALLRAGVEPIGGDDLPIASFRLPGLTPREVEDLLDRVYDISVRAGLHCAPLAHDTLRTSPEGTVRVSTGPTTTAADLSRLTEALIDLSSPRVREAHA